MDFNGNMEEKTFREVVMPVIQWLAKHKNPHISIVITSVSAELLEGVEIVTTEDY